MVKLDKAAAVLGWLDSLEASERVEGLRRALSERDGRVVMKAARLAVEWGLAEVGPQLAAAFDKMVSNGAKVDPGCLAKVAVVDALHSLEYVDYELYLRGVRCVQMEQVWGDPIDTAGDLRASSARALARNGYPGVRNVLVDLLADGEVRARRGAVLALTDVAGEASEVLLRLKARMGDEDPDVTGLCLSALMALSPAESLDFVASFLEHSSESVAEGAALALGESRDEAALGVLIARWNGEVNARARAAWALPIALSRRDEGFRHLLTVVREECMETAVAAVNALRIFRDDSGRVAQVRDAVDARGDRKLAAAFNEAFGGAAD